ncbi:hypothetical protein [Micromonospora schwarzwaldensis]|uniref:hypothetical protein n=1 Tax=Micromonospora sp. DSM 45708 TaxID=3111767 RepID=UPI0031E355E5
MKKLANAVTFLLGLASLVAGAHSVVVGRESTGATALITVGAVLLLSPLLLHRVERLRLGAEGVELSLSQEFVSLGAPEAALILGRSDVAKLSESYSFVSRELASDEFKAARTHLEDVLASRASAVAEREKFNAGEVRGAFLNAPKNLRVLLLGLMEGDISLVDGQTLIASLSAPLSANEQYHGLKLTIRCWHRLSDADKMAIMDELRKNRDIAPETDRWPLLQTVLGLPLGS